MEDKSKITEKALGFDFTAPISEEEWEEAVDILSQYLLFGTKWEAISLKNSKIRRGIPIINDLSLICKTDNCPYARKCPVIKNMTFEQKKMLEGTECRADRIYAVEQFTTFVRNLQIDPDQSTDIINVATMVRLLIVKRRVDWEIALSGLVGREPAGIDQRTGQVYWKSVGHPLIKLSSDIDSQLGRVQKQLMADREARTKMAQSLGKGASEIFKSLFSANPSALPENSLEAEFSEVKEEEEQ